jgi:hypothetical protein
VLDDVTPPRVSVLAALLTWGLGSPAVAGAEWIADAGADVFYEDNVGLAEKRRDIKSDVGMTTAVSAGAAVPLGDRHVASLTADVSATGFERVQGLSHVAAGASAAFRTKFGVGPQAPWARVSGSVARLDYDYDLRDGWRYRLGAGVGKRLGERVEVRAEYTYERRRADETRAIVATLPGDVFDLTSHTGSVRADVLLTEALTLSAGYALREGDVVSTTHRNPAVFAASTALANDRAFGRDFFAYRIDATTHTVSAGLSYALTRTASLNVGYDRSLGEASRGLEYLNHIVRVGLLYRY